MNTFKQVNSIASLITLDNMYFAHRARQDLEIRQKRKDFQARYDTCVLALIHNFISSGNEGCSSARTQPKETLRFVGRFRTQDDDSYFQRSQGEYYLRVCTRK